MAVWRIARFRAEFWARLRTNQFYWDWAILEYAVDPRGTTINYGWDSIRHLTDQYLPDGTNRYRYGRLDLTNVMSAQGLSSVSAIRVSPGYPDIRD